MNKNTNIDEMKRCGSKRGTINRIVSSQTRQLGDLLISSFQWMFHFVYFFCLPLLLLLLLLFLIRFFLIREH